MKYSLLEFEKQRYSQKGIKNITIGLFLLVFVHLAIYKCGEMLWNQNIEYKRSFIFGYGCLVHTLTALFCLLIYSSSYYYKLPWIEKYRVEPQKPWHWQRDNWPQLMKSTIKTLFTVHFIFFPIGILIGLRKMKLDFSFPSLSEHFIHIIFCLLVQDSLFYWSHRILHMYPYLYQKIHKKHHQYDAPYANSAQYAHPIQYLFGNMIPAATGIFILGQNFHAFTYLVYIFLRMMNTQQTHSGIDIPWSPIRVLPFTTSTSFHNFHHSKNVGTYGSLFYLWDFFTTSGEYYFNQLMKPKVNKDMKQQ